MGGSSSPGGLGRLSRFGVCPATGGKVRPPSLKGRGGIEEAPNGVGRLGRSWARLCNIGSPGAGWNVGVGGGRSGSSSASPVGGKAGTGVGVGGMSGVGAILASTREAVAAPALLGPGVGMGVGASSPGSGSRWGSNIFFALASCGRGSMTCLSSRGCLTFVSSEALALTSVPAASGDFLSLVHSLRALSPSCKAVPSFLAISSI